MEQWYKITIDGIHYYPISVLRNKKDCRYNSLLRTVKTKDIPEELPKNTVCMKIIIYRRLVSVVPIIENSRISAHPNMAVEDFSPKNSRLSCQIIFIDEKYATGSVRHS